MNSHYTRICFDNGHTVVTDGEGEILFYRPCGKGPGELFPVENAGSVIDYQAKSFDSYFRWEEKLYWLQLTPRMVSLSFTTEATDNIASVRALRWEQIAKQ